ncbi:MAG: HlyD family efflux transporter periplasmic adaptor subunit [Planctomycetaceae bacterium]
MHRSPHLPARQLLLLTALIAVSLPEQTSAQNSTQTSTQTGTAKARPPVISSRASRVQPGDAADIPAPERGPLLRMLVEQGSVVRQGDVLAELDQAEALLALKLAEQELQAAEQKQTSSRLSQVAAAAVAEAERQSEQAALDAEQAQLSASDTSTVQLAAAKESEAAAALQLADSSRKASPRSVSDREYLALTSQREQAAIATQQARHEKALAELKARSLAKAAAQQQAAVARLRLLQENAEGTEQAELQQLEVLRTTVEIARQKVQRRKLLAPFDGTVTERHKAAGEWLEPGEPVLRLIQTSRLIVDGVVSIEESQRLQAGQAVRVRRLGAAAAAGQGSAAAGEQAAARLIFVSPEVDALNDAVRVRAEVPQPPAWLRPGAQVLLEIAQ